MKILIIGAKGFLGQKAVDYFSKGNEVIKAGISESEEFKLDATDKEAVLRFVSEKKPDVIFDTVALTSSLKCEQNPGLARKLNYETAKNISEAAQNIGAWIVFMSSSYLFDGEEGNYNESDKTSPINEYAKNKILAERAVLKNPKGIVLRVDIMYGYNNRGAGNGVFDMILSGNPIKLRDTDQLRQPLFVEDVPRIALELIKKEQNGIFHLAGPNRMKMVEFLKKLEVLVRKDSIISKDDSESKISLKIPHNATFNTSKTQKLGIKFTSFEEALEIMKKQIGN